MQNCLYSLLLLYPFETKSKAARIGKYTLFSLCLKTGQAEMPLPGMVPGL